MPPRGRDLHRAARADLAAQESAGLGVDPDWCLQESAVPVGAGQGVARRLDPALVALDQDHLARAPRRDPMGRTVVVGAGCEAQETAVLPQLAVGVPVAVEGDEGELDLKLNVDRDGKTPSLAGEAQAVVADRRAIARNRELLGRVLGTGGSGSGAEERHGERTGGECTAIEHGIPRGGGAGPRRLRGELARGSRPPLTAG
jgi:hypothetical protein